AKATTYSAAAADAVSRVRKERVLAVVSFTESPLLGKPGYVIPTERTVFFVASKLLDVHEAPLAPRFTFVSAGTSGQVQTTLSHEPSVPPLPSARAAVVQPTPPAWPSRFPTASLKPSYAS